MYNNPFKDWFYFTRQQRYGIILLLVLIIVVPVTGKMVTALRRHQGLDEASFLTMLDAYREHLADLEEILAAKEKSKAASGIQNVEKPTTLALQPKPFDPNTLTVEGWQEMGIPARISRSIQNFLAAGGSFRHKQDLQRMYLVDDALYAELEPWVTLPDRPERDKTVERRHGGQDRQAPETQSDPASTGRSGPDQHQHELAELRPDRTANVYAEEDPGGNDAFSEASRQVVLPDHRSITTARPVSVNINKADTTAFQEIRGIGPVFSRRIVRYRELLGGYYCTSQLLEVFGMDSTRYAGIQDFIEPDTLLIQRINLNTASFGDLVRHPYIDQPVASAILNLRDQHGPFACPTDIKSSYLIDDAGWERLRPYLFAGQGEDQ